MNDARRWMRALIALFFLAQAAGCGPRPAPAALPPSPFIAASPVPTHGAQAPLQVIGRFRDEQGEAMGALLGRFTAASGVAAEYEGAEAVPELLRARLAAGTTPDVLFLPIPAWLGELAGAGAIAPLSDEAAIAVQQNFGPAWVNLVSHEGALYGVPFDANAKSLLWVRPAALAAVNQVLPTTLDDLEAFAAALEARGEVAFAVPGEIGWPLTDWWENVLLAEAGPEVYDDLIAHRRPWTDPAVERAARRFVGLLRDPWLLGGAEGAATLPLTVESFERAFDPQAPGAAMWLGQGSVIANLAAPGTLQPGRDFDFFPFPADGAVVGVGSVAVATNAEPATMALLAFLAQPQSVEPWVRAGGLISPNRAVPLDAYPSPLARREAELLANAALFRYDLSDLLPPNLKDPFLPDQLRQMLLRPTDVPAILAEIERVATREQGAPRR